MFKLFGSIFLLLIKIKEVIKVFTVKFIKLPKKFKEFSETNRAYSLDEVSQFYFNATAMYPELANQKIKLEIHDSFDDQSYSIETNIHLDLSLADLVAKQINKTIMKTDDSEQLTSLKSRITTAFKVGMQSFEREEFSPDIIPKIEESSRGELIEDEQVTEAVTFDLDDSNPFTIDIAALALGETDRSDRNIIENTASITLLETEEFLDISDFKVMKKLESLKEDVKLKMSEMDPVITADLELLLLEIEECKKGISEKVNQNLITKCGKRIENAHAEFDTYKQTIELELDAKFDFKIKSLESEIKQSFEVKKQALKDKYEREVTALEVAQKNKQDKWLLTQQENLDFEYKQELFELCKEELKRIENTTLNYLENAKFEFDQTLSEEASPQIDSLFAKHTKIMNKISQFSTPLLKMPENSNMVNDALTDSSFEMISPTMVSNNNDEHITSVISSLLELKLDEMQDINKKSNDEHYQLISELTSKTADLESKLENNANQLTEMHIPYTNIGLKLLLGVSVAVTLFIGLFAYIQINNVQEFNGQLISRNQRLESQLLEISANEPEIIGSTILTFNEYLSNGNYQLAAINYPEEVSALVRHLFEREDVYNLRIVLEVVTETYGWLNVAILEEDHYSIIREFENLLPSEQAELTIRQQKAVSIAYIETDRIEAYSGLQILGDETNQGNNGVVVISNK